MVTLSKRLKMVADLVTKSGVLADVGCDHGYTSIYLVQQGICQKAIAMDVNPGPLSRAKEHIAAHGLGDYIETRLSDGLSALSPGEASAIVIAGMGGATMEKILMEGREAAAGAAELILQPQSELFRFREFLDEQRYVILAEAMVKEDGKYYPMMRVAPGQGVSRVPLTRLEKQYGPLLLKERNPVLLDFLKWRHGQLVKVLSQLEAQGNSQAGARRRGELMQELLGLQECMDFFNM